jgi:hypothetical protein
MKKGVVLGLWVLLSGLLLFGSGTVAEDEDKKAVVINEIAWSGTKASSADEWIELFNNSNQDIDLSGWKLCWEGITIHFSEVMDNTKEIRNTIIPAGGFYLLERTDDNTISDIEADLIYTGSLANEGELLILKDNEGNIIDTANGDGGEWPAGTASEGEPPYASMERVDPNIPESWRTNDGETIGGLDAKGNPINGTPKMPNSAKPE